MILKCNVIGDRTETQRNAKSGNSKIRKSLIERKLDEAQKSASKLKFNEGQKQRAKSTDIRN